MELNGASDIGPCASARKSALAMAAAAAAAAAAAGAEKVKYLGVSDVISVAAPAPLDEKRTAEMMTFLEQNKRFESRADKQHRETVLATLGSILATWVKNVSLALDPPIVDSGAGNHRLRADCHRGQRRTRRRCRRALHAAAASRTTPTLRVFRKRTFTVPPATGVCTIASTRTIDLGKRRGALGQRRRGRG